jgi:hypothetical protein
MFHRRRLKLVGRLKINSAHLVSPWLDGNLSRPALPDKGNGHTVFSLHGSTARIVRIVIQRQNCRAADGYPADLLAN